MAMYSQFEKDRDQGNFELLPELHAILSGMKVHPHLLLRSASDGYLVSMSCPHSFGPRREESCREKQQGFNVLLGCC